MINKSLISLSPHVVTKVWGGSRLAKLKNINSQKIGETWEVSIHPDGPSCSNDSKLSDMISPEQLPYLIKFIDTSDNLSVQVHPDDDYAAKNENSSGKTECWLILDAGEKSGIYLGFKKDVDPRTFDQSVTSGEDLTKYLQFHPVKRGDFFFVPAGSVHAIGSDVFLCEIQQSSGITYRVWDWNRMGDDGKPRQLHIAKAMDVLRFENSFNDLKTFKVKKELLKHVGSTELIDHPQFNVELFNLETGHKLEVVAGPGPRYSALVALEGSLILDEKDQLNAYNSLLLKEGAKLTIKSSGKSSFILVS